jgi:ribosomal-protein-alanine N-acetyltransferase
VLTIQKFQADDIFALIKLSMNVLTESYNPNLYSYFYEEFPWGFWVCKNNDELIGFIIGIKTDYNNGKIIMLGVDEKHRRCKIGSSLIKQLIDEFKKRNIKTVELEVQSSNKNAINFYSKMNFKIEEKIPFFYQNGENAILMKLSLVH